MPLFDWSNRFSVGIKEMDEQHKKLIGLLNEFHDAKLAGKDEEVMTKLLNDLLGYTKTHFKKEEELMLQYEFSEHDAHKSLHLRLVEKVKALQEKFLTGGKVSIYSEMAILLNDWLAEHIMIEDKKYGTFIDSEMMSAQLSRSNIGSKIKSFDDVCVGIQEIDEQHLQVWDLFNSILKAKEKNNEEEIMDTLGKLFEQWETHFKYEEDLMEKYEYSGFAEHKKEHDDINQKILNLKEMQCTGLKNVVPAITGYLNLWIEEHVKHIDGEDKKLAEHLKSKGVT